MRLLLCCFLLFSTPLLAQTAGKVTTTEQAKPPQKAAADQSKSKTTASTADQLKPPGGGLESDYPDITTQAVVLIFVALLPFLIMLLTSFMKMVITLSLLRSALGVQQSPPNQVINGIALILTIYVMYPTGYQMYDVSKDIINHKTQPDKFFSGDTANMALAIVNKAKEPLREFLIRNSNKKHIDGFYKIAEKTFPDEVKPYLQPRDYIVVVPAFITTQIKAAFEIGVLIYLPFFVIDLVTSNILLAMQMMMLSPLSISLPLKLLLVVMIDGWTVLLEGLVLSFH